MSLHLRANTAPFEEMLQWWQAVGNSAKLTTSRFKPQTSHSRDKCITTQPTGWFFEIHAQVKALTQSFQ